MLARCIESPGCCGAATPQRPSLDVYKRQGISLVAVTLGSTTTQDRFNAAATLLDFGFANWAVTTPALPTDQLGTVAVENGMFDLCLLYTSIFKGRSW